MTSTTRKEAELLWPRLMIFASGGSDDELERAGWTRAHAAETYMVVKAFSEGMPIEWFGRGKWNLVDGDKNCSIGWLEPGQRFRVAGDVPDLDMESIPFGNEV